MDTALKLLALSEFRARKARAIPYLLSCFVLIVHTPAKAQTFQATSVLNQIGITSSSSMTFASAVASLPSTTQLALDPFSAFSIAIQNNSNQDLLSLVATWTLTDVHNEITHRVVERTISLQLGKKGLAPGGVLLVTPLCMTAATLSSTSCFVRNANDIKLSLTAAKAISLKVNSALFSPGVFTGTNDTHLYEKLTAQLTVDKQMAKVILTMLDNQISSDRIALWLKQQRDSSSRTTGPLDQNWTAVVTRMTASHFITALQEKDQAGLRSTAEAIISEPRLELTRK